MKNKSILVAAYEVLQQENEKDFWEHEPIAPKKTVKFNPFNIPISKKRNFTKNTLSKVLYFIDSKKHIRFTDKEHNGLTVMGISVKNKKLKSICGGSIKQVSRLIDYMIQIGLLAEYDESYQYNSKNNYSKQYCYSYHTELKVLEYCKQNGIEKSEHINGTKKILSSKNIIGINIADVKFSSKLNLQKPPNYSQKQFEEYLYSVLHHNYPNLKKYQDIANHINKTYDEARKIYYEPTFKWNSKNTSVIKIGIRATNSLCNCKKEFEPKDLNRNFLYRKDVLKKYKLNYSYDIKSSVPRVTVLLNTGVWLDSRIDLYELMAAEFNQMCSKEYLKWNSFNRKVFKKFHMLSYFDSYNMISAHLKRRISLKTKYKRDDWVRLDDAMICYKKSVEIVLGKLWDNEIFFHESNIYLDVLFELVISRGTDVLMIYDSFYLRTEVKDIEKIIAKCAENYIKTVVDISEKYKFF